MEYVMIYHCSMGVGYRVMSRAVKGMPQVTSVLGRPSYDSSQVTSV